MSDEEPVSRLDAVIDGLLGGLVLLVILVLGYTCLAVLGVV